MTFRNELLAIALTLLSACAATTRKPVVECRFPTEPAPTGPALVAKVYGETSPIPLNSVQFTDSGLARQVAVQTMRASRTPANTVRISARLVNCTDVAQAVNARTSFLAADDAPAEPESAWKTVVLQPRTSAVYTQTSLATDVQSYLLELRPDGYRGAFP
jgi:hypothetical protein